MWNVGKGRAVQAIGADCGSRQLLSTERKHQTTPDGTAQSWLIAAISFNISLPAGPAHPVLHKVPALGWCLVSASDHYQPQMGGWCQS